MKREVTKNERFLLEHVSDFTNRSMNQTLFLFELCDFDFNILMALENKFKNTFTFYCPSTKDEVEEVFNKKSSLDETLFERKNKWKK